jgi:hypothetical protein
MATAKNPLISQLDAAAHRLGVQLRERGLNRRMLTLYYANSIWDITNDGDMLKIKGMDRSSSVPLWEERRPVEDVIEVMESIARRMERAS